MNVSTDPSTHKPRAAALREWRRQLAAGERTPTTFDALWAAAGDEQLVLEHEADGLPEIAARYWSEARPTRRALAPLRRLAKQTGAVILGLRHPSKRIALGPVLNMGNGSIAYGGVARGSMLVTVDPADADRRLLLATKSNISRLAATLAFRLECQADEDIPPKVIWDRTPDPRTAEDVLADLRSQEQANPNDVEAEQGKREQDVHLLEECLGAGWLPVVELDALARQRGVTAKTLRFAKETLDLQYHREGFEKGSRWHCALPGSAPFLPLSASKGKNGGNNSDSTAQPVVAQHPTDAARSCPSPSCPSEKMGRGARTAGPPPDVSTGPTESRPAGSKLRWSSSRVTHWRRTLHERRAPPRGGQPP